jgi:ABC-type oligopeptide transport system substrate-binding subunit/class 3 adenylate cyclase
MDGREVGMHCPKCNTENRENAKFCINCGARLMLVCPECGTQLPPSARFCDACGAQVGALPGEVREEPGAPDAVAERLQRLVPRELAERLRASGGEMAGERRMVTILFCDVTGSTAMAEDLDPEDVMEIMDGAFDVLIEPIVRYEGTVARLMGDAVLAFFGAPIAHEDDPERACRAALEIVEGARAYGDKLARERGLKGFDVRVGINTGLVVVGEVGSDLRVEYTAMGDAINVAARMEGAAEPGTILVTEDTHKLIAPLFETEALGPIEAKGKAEPVSTYRVMALKEVPGKARGIAGLDSPLVGRKEEVAALEKVLERLEAGVGGIVTIVGEAGIGKSRLVAEVRKRNLAKVREPDGSRDPSQGLASIQWVEGRCLSYGSSIAYLLWLDVLRNLLGITPERPPTEVRDVLREAVTRLCPESFDDVYPYLGRLMSLPLEAETQVPLKRLNGKELKAKTFGALEMVLAGAADEHPLVAVCEDLHWADPTSIEVLEQLLPLTGRASLLMMCVFRLDKEHGSWRLRETAAREYGYRHTDLWLERLSAAESETLVRNLLRLEALPQELRARILSQAEGNPLYAEEIIRSLIDEGAVVRDEVRGRWEATQEVDAIPIPDTLQGVLTARIDRLEHETKRVLQMAAVIGRVFLYRVLAAIAEEERRLDDRLLTLQQEELIRERARLPELEYIFKHELTREAAYNGLLKRERRVFHRQVAEALERLFPGRVKEQAGLLAHHWERAGDAEKAVHYLLDAGDRARDLYAHAEAVGYYERALAFLRQEGDNQRAARTLMKLGLAYHTAFDFDHSRAAYDEGLAMWQKSAKARPSAQLAPPPHPLRLVASGEPGSLDPAMASDTESAVVIGELFAGLVALTPEMDVIPDIARGWEVLAGGRRYVFHLRDDVRWSDGAPLTARDFVCAWKRVLSPHTDSPVANLLYDIKGARAFHQGQVRGGERVGVQAKDDVTLLVELERPTGCFLQLLTDPRLYTVPEHAVESHGPAWAEPECIVTSGPFVLAEWQRGKRLVLARHPRYTGPSSGNVERVEFFFRPPEERWAALAMYDSNRVDVLPLLIFPGAELEDVVRRHAGEHVSLPAPTTWSFVLNTARAPLDDTRVRRALALCTDRKRMGRVTGSAFPAATGGFVPPGIPGHSSGIGVPYDPKRARQILAEAGYPGGRGLPALDVLLLSAVHSRSFAAILEADWRKELGVEARLAFEPGGLYYQKVRDKQPHVSFSGWHADYPDPDNFLRVCLDTWLSYTRWENGVYQDLVEQAGRITDQEKRMALYREADRILMEEAVVLPLSYGREDWLIKPWVKRYPVSPIRELFAKDVVIEAH